jgi:hypothetical protein
MAAIYPMYLNEYLKTLLVLVNPGDPLQFWSTLLKMVYHLKRFIMYGLLPLRGLKLY